MIRLFQVMHFLRALAWLRYSTHQTQKTEQQEHILHFI